MRVEDRALTAGPISAFILHPSSFIPSALLAGKLRAIVRATMSEQKQAGLMEKIVALCKRRGFIFQSSEIYGGINGFWD